MTTRCSATALLGDYPSVSVTLHCVLPREAHNEVSRWTRVRTWHLAVFRGRGYKWRDDSLKPTKFP